MRIYIHYTTNYNTSIFCVIFLITFFLFPPADLNLYAFLLLAFIFIINVSSSKICRIWWRFEVWGLIVPSYYTLNQEINKHPRNAESKSSNITVKLSQDPSQLQNKQYVSSSHIIKLVFFQFLCTCVH